MTGPLGGFRFLELGASRAGAYAGRLLALLGAEVTVVTGRGGAEPPAPDPLTEGKSFLPPGTPAPTGDQLARLPFAGALSSEPVEGAPYPVVVSPTGPGPLADWAASGLMELTGLASGPPQPGPPGLMVAARGAALALTLLRRVAEGRGGASAPGGEPDLDGPALLGERAALGGLSRAGQRSPAGSTRLLQALDGWVALTLARPEDLDLLAAWTRAARDPDPWRAAARYLAGTEARRAVERAQLLGLPAATAAEPESSFEDAQAEARGQGWPPSPYLVDGSRPRLTPAFSGGIPMVRGVPKRPRGPGPVIDLSVLWAGPLCASLVPGRVVKVESASRPDGARAGPACFFDLLNGPKESVVLDLSEPGERALLRRLLAESSLAVESARSRGLAGLGLDPVALRAEGCSAGWVRITGYGSTGPWQGRVAFGDDAAAAGGLAAATGSRAGMPGTVSRETSVHTPAGSGPPLHCGDAVADPLTGLHAAVAGAALQVGGGSHVIEVAMREVVGHSLFAGGAAAGTLTTAVQPEVVWSAGGWRLRCEEGDLAVGRPRARPVLQRARPAGADRAGVLASFGIAPSRPVAETVVP